LIATGLCLLLQFLCQLLGQLLGTLQLIAHLANRGNFTLTTRIAIFSLLRRFIIGQCLLFQLFDQFPQLSCILCHLLNLIRRTVASGRVKSQQALGKFFDLAFQFLLDIDREIDHAIPEYPVTGLHFFANRTQISGCCLCLRHQALICVIAARDYCP
jgi:hypothetical protein